MPAVPVPPLAPRASAPSASLNPAAASSASAAASSSSTNYVSYTHHLKGSRVWHWDGRSGINLIFIVALLLGLLALFAILVALSRLLARTNAPSTDAVLPFERRAPRLPQQAPSMSQMPPSVRPLFDDRKASLTPLSSHPNPSSFVDLPNPRYPMSTPNGSAASSSQNVLAPLLSIVPPVGSRLKRQSSGPDGPPPRGNPKRNSRYHSANAADALPHRRPTGRSNTSSSSFHSTDDTQHGAAAGGVQRVQSIGRGNSLRYSRSLEADEPAVELGRKNSARLAAQARARRSQANVHSVNTNVQPYRDVSPPPAVSGSSEESSYPFSHYKAGDSTSEILSRPPSGRGRNRP